jgi:uncharacterized membrane protein
MEDFFINIFQISFCCGWCFLLVAGITYFFPPKKINNLYGYRTAGSMKSQERWDFAQRYSTVQMIKSALFMIIASLAGYLFAPSAALDLAAGLGIMVIAVVYMIADTERQLKKRFSES